MSQMCPRINPMGESGEISHLAIVNHGNICVQNPVEP